MLEYTNDDFFRLEYQTFLHNLYSISHLLCISSVISCITGSPFLFLFYPLPFQSYRRSHQVWLPSYCHKDQLPIIVCNSSVRDNHSIIQKYKALELKMYWSGAWYSAIVDSDANTLHRRMGWLSQRTGLSVRIPEPCCMIRDYHYFCGKRPPIHLFTCKKRVLIEIWGMLLQRRLSWGRSLNLGTYVSLSFWYILISRRRGGPN